MCRRSCTVLAIAFGISCTIPCTGSAASADTSVAHDDSAFESRILTITDVVLQKHIDPPTRQQMILAGVKALYRANEQPAPKGLSEQVSALATPVQIADYLQNVRADFSGQDDVESVLTSGMLEAVAGRSFLIDADVDKVQGQLAANRYVGTGIALAMSNEKQPKITKVFYDGPAWKAGIRENDIFVEIDGESTASQTLKDVVEQLRGEEGSEVDVVVRQPKATESRVLTITRGRVFIPTVEGHREISPGEWEFTIESAENIALIRINRIGPSTLHELRQVEAKLRGRDIRAIVLDLRSGGGVLHDLVMVADAFLDGGIIGHVRSLDSVKKFEARAGALFQNVPMAVLIAKDAATDRVFLTAALQDRQRAVVIGERTTGKTYVNELIPIPGRSDKIRLAVAVMQRGDGTTLLAGPEPWSPLAHIQGTEQRKTKKKLPGFIVPDHRVTPVRSPNPSEAPRDPMLAKAIEVLSATKAQAQSGARQQDVSG